MTVLYIFRREDEPLPEAAEVLLPAWRRERTVRLKNPAARQESLAAGLLWRRAMLDRDVPPEAAVTVLPAGKPVLARWDDVHFSLSHSGAYALCAVGDRPVGTDVQEPRRVRLSMNRYFHPAEREWLAAQASAEDAFFRLWARKEAWVKAVSRERFLSLAEVDVIHPLPGLRFWDYELPGGVRAALCGEDEPGKPIWISREELLHGEPCHSPEKQEDKP